jgi:sugar/nucleoside kinase (ribokinase family)
MYRFLEPLSSVDYLVIGHITQDITPTGKVLGGTATYAALTARSLGLRVGVVTSVGSNADLTPLSGLQLQIVPSEFTSVFENIQTPTGRVQKLHSQAAVIHPENIPSAWRSCPIVHFGPVAQEIDPQCLDLFPSSLIGLTPQGWMRAWNENGAIFFQPHPRIFSLYKKASCVILSIEDVQRQESVIEEMLNYLSLLVVTEGSEGCRVYWNGDVRRVRPPKVNELDSTGAGDIFAAAFFFRLSNTRDPWLAAEFATRIAARSVTRRLIDSPPTPQEAQENLIEIIGNT